MRNGIGTHGTEKKVKGWGVGCPSATGIWIRYWDVTTRQPMVLRFQNLARYLLLFLIRILKEKNLIKQF